jgi:three-Cys-motif partner protein
LADSRDVQIMRRTHCPILCFAVEQTKNIEIPMADQLFGGPWTERKLSVVRRYLERYAQALKNQAFERIYIDAFAGSGGRTDKRRLALPLLDLPEFASVATGSTRIALEVEPPFHRYIFIERATRRASQLSALESEFPNRNITIVNADANDAIKDICTRTNWQATRGVAFLDPYGLQVSWDTLVAISRTSALDAWILFPTGMGLNRLLTKRGIIRKEWQSTLDRFLGTHEWRSAFYRIEQTPDLFDDSRQQRMKTAGTEKFEIFILGRLRTIFPVVLDKSVGLTNSKGQTMYLLCFVSANPLPSVRALATRLAGWAAKA